MCSIYNAVLDVLVHLLFSSNVRKLNDKEQNIWVKGYVNSKIFLDIIKLRQTVFQFTFPPREIRGVGECSFPPSFPTMCGIKLLVLCPYARLKNSIYLQLKFIIFYYKIIFAFLLCFSLNFYEMFISFPGGIEPQWLQYIHTR